MLAVQLPALRKVLHAALLQLGATGTIGHPPAGHLEEELSAYADMLEGRCFFGQPLDRRSSDIVASRE